MCIPSVRTVLISAGVFLGILFLVMVAVDTGAIGGLGDRIAGRASALGRDPRPMWWYLFGGGWLIEFAQWILLGLASIYAAVAATQSAQHGDRQAVTFWTILAFAAAALLIEDAGDPSHRAHHIAQAAGLPYAYVVGRGSIFALLALLTLSALPYRQTAWQHPPVRRFHLIGFVSYGVGATMSVPGNLINLYERAGIWILQGVFRGSLRGLPPGSEGFGPTEFGDPTPIAFMDYVVEESIELVAAAMFAAAAVAGARYAMDRQRSLVTATPESPGG